MAADYRRVEPKRFPQVQEHDTAEARYWRRFTRPQVETHPAPVTCVHFAATPPHDFAVTCSTHVAVHSGKTGRELRSVGRYEDIAYSAQFRADGRLLASGDKAGVVSVVEAQSKGVLRSWKQHRAPVRVVRWASDGLRLASGSDDKTVRLWDLPTSDALQVRRGHTDYVRALAASPMTPDLFVSGSYDHSVRLWDMRQAGSVLGVDHGAPVEACLLLPGGGLCASAGGNMIKIWDLLGGGRLLHTLSNHQKTISCLCLDGTRTRLLSAGLDRHVKIYDLQTYQVTHGLKFHAPILSLALSPDNALLVASTTDGALTVRRREGLPGAGPGTLATGALAGPGAGAVGGKGGGEVGGEQGAPGERRRKAPRTGTVRYFNRGGWEGPGEQDVKVGHVKTKAMAPYDHCLRRFEYREALDAALGTGPKKDNTNPLVVTAVLEELGHRGGLEHALSGRDEESLAPILAFLTKYITDVRYTPLLLEVAASVLDLYSQVVGHSEPLLRMFQKLQSQVKLETFFQKDLLGLLGAMDAIFYAAGEGREDHVAAGEGGTEAPPPPRPPPPHGGSA